MKQFLFPAVFIKTDEGYTVVFPDLNISTEGTSIEEAYLFAKDYLRVYCSYVVKFDLDIDRPSKFEKIQQKYTEGIVQLVDVIM